MERDPLVRGLLLMLAAIGLVWLAGWVWQIVSRFGDVILLFFLAWLLAFVLNPIALRLQRLGLPRPAAVGGVYVGLALMLVTIGLLVVPAALTQLVQLGASLPAMATNLQARADELHAYLIDRGLPEAQLADFYRNAVVRAEAIGTSLLANVPAVAGAIVGSLVSASLVLIISFYIMLDGERLGSALIQLLPARYRESAAGGLEQVDRTFGGFVRGQLIQALVYGLGTFAVMQLAQLSYALVLSIFAGVMMSIPVIGPFLAMAPPLILAVILAPQTVWWVFVLLFGLQFVVVNILAPKIMSQSVGIHPLLVFAAVLIGAKLAQGWGAIFGVPIAAMLYLVARFFYQRVVLRTPLYRTGTPLSVEAIVPPAPAPAPPADPEAPAPAGPQAAPAAAAAGAPQGVPPPALGPPAPAGAPRDRVLGEAHR